MWYLKSAFDAYQKVQETVESRLSDVRSAAMSPLNMVKNFLMPQAPAGPSSAGELEVLRARVAELEARLDRPKRTPKKRGARSSR